MTRIGLLSDAHSFLEDAVFKHFENCDEIWHAGDFGEGVANHLNAESGRTVKGVYGNIDDASIRKELQIHQPQLFISGHSHILKVMYDTTINCLHMNPGAAGKHGWHKVRTIIRFAIDGKEMKNCEVIELGKR